MLGLYWEREGYYSVTWLYRIDSASNSYCSAAAYLQSWGPQTTLDLYPSWLPRTACFLRNQLTWWDGSKLPMKPTSFLQATPEIMRGEGIEARCHADIIIQMTSFIIQDIIHVISSPDTRERVHLSKEFVNYRITLKMQFATYHGVQAADTLICLHAASNPDFNRSWLDLSIQKFKNAYPLAQQRVKMPHCSDACFAGDLTALVPSCRLWLTTSVWVVVFNYNCSSRERFSFPLNAFETVECPKDKWENPTSWLAWAAMQAVQEWLPSTALLLVCIACCNGNLLFVPLGTIWFLKLEEKMNDEASTDRVGKMRAQGSVVMHAACLWVNRWPHFPS